MCNKSIRRVFGIILFGAILAAFIIAGCSPEDDPSDSDAPRIISVRWNTGGVGTYAYTVASPLVELLNRELPEHYRVTIHPIAGGIAPMKETMESDGIAIGVSGDIGITQLYAEMGAYSFESWPARKDANLLVHSFWAYPCETSLAIHKSNADKFKRWGDLSGEPIFFAPAGYMNHLNLQRAFDVLGYDFNHIELDTGMVADALRQGSITATSVYTTAGLSPPAWVREMELRLGGELVVIGPSDDEIEKLKAAGLAVAEVEASKAFSTDVGVDTYTGAAFYFGYNLTMATPAEFVKLLLEIVEANVEELTKFDPGFKPLADDFVGLQVSAINMNPHVPVHPGLAEFLKERNAWDESWKIAD